MEKRKILIITNRIPYPLKDGGNLAMNAMINGYRNEGWKVFLLSMNTSRHHVAHKVLEKLFTNLYAFQWVTINNKIKPYQLILNFLFSKKPESAERFYHESFKTKLVEVLNSFQPDVVQSESVFLSTYLPVIKQHSSALTVLRLHNIEYHIWQSLSAKTKNFLKKYYFKNLTRRIRRFEKNSWHQYDLLLPITNKDEAHVLKNNLTNGVFVAPFGIDVEKIKTNFENEKWAGYHIGAMDWIPNREGILWFLEKVWPRLHKTFPSFEFYFAGRDMPKSLKKIKLSGVHCMDEVPNANEFIADKKILIVPLQSGSGIRVKILEAMAAGKIVITTVNGIKGIDARAGEEYLLANRPEDFIRSIKWCLENKSQAEKLTQNARHLILDKYNNSKIIKNVVAEIESLIDRKNLV